MLIKLYSLIPCVMVVIVTIALLPFIINPIQLQHKVFNSLKDQLDSTCMRKLEHCTLCLPQLLIVGYSLCCEEANTTQVALEEKEISMLCLEVGNDIEFKMAIS